MLAAKWSAVLVAVVTVALDILANVLVAVLTPDSVPGVVNTYAVAVAAVATIFVVIVHCYARLEAKLDTTTTVMVNLLHELQERIGDRDSAFVEGYNLAHEREPAPVLPMPRTTRRATETP